MENIKVLNAILMLRNAATSGARIAPMDGELPYSANPLRADLARLPNHNAIRVVEVGVPSATELDEARAVLRRVNGLTLVELVLNDRSGLVLFR